MQFLVFITGESCLIFETINVNTKRAEKIPQKSVYSLLFGKLCKNCDFILYILLPALFLLRFVIIELKVALEFQSHYGTDLHDIQIHTIHI